MCELTVLKQQENKPSPGSRKHKLWEINSTLLCSIVGTCLTLDEIYKILNSCRISFNKDLSDYDIHNAFVAMANKSSKATRQAQKLMDTKYATEIRKFSKARNDIELSKLWDQGFKEGRVAGIYWALVTHPFITPQLKMRAFGEVHMLSHQMGATNRAEIKQHSVLEKQCIDLKTQLTISSTRNARLINKRDITLRKLQEKLSNSHNAEQQLKLATRKIRHLENGKEVQKLRIQINELQESYSQSHHSEIRAIKKNENLSQQLKASQNTNIDLKRTLHQQQIAVRQLQHNIAASAQLPVAANDITQTDINLCGQCVLFVGGRSGQCSHFRDLVESNNGRFLHHDGGREDSPQRLGSILPQADVVLCPIDCVSHDAVHRIKRFCSDHSKPLLFMPRASLSAFTQSLQQIVN